MISLNQEPVVKTEMNIRKPVEEVFAAFVDPEITTKFWFTKSSGKLEFGKHVRWEWEMYGASTNVYVKQIEENKSILIEWEEPYGYSTVHWTFTPRTAQETIVEITNSGFKGDGDDMVGQAIDSMGGFTIVLCGLKAYLEHGIVLNLIADKAPDAHIKQ
ncbi:SRPBCC family protein [Planococcus sp. 1R117A]|uniref:SRPBCC family protein n=1 Tax=Planococcus sp. 1R117A TaxID=3447020 RepID=UPI003EDC67B6